MTIFSLENLFYLYWKCPLFWALFWLLLFKFIQVQLSRLSLWTSLIYDQLYLHNFLWVFWTLVVHPSLSSMNEWMFSIFTFHYVWIRLKLNIWILFTLSIIFMAVWFVHLGNHFISSWVYEWISYYITKIEQNESFRFAINYRPFMNDTPFHWLYLLSRLGTII